MLVAAVFGSQALAFLDPITLFNRFMAGAAWPMLGAALKQSESFLYRFEFLWPILDKAHQAVVSPLFPAESMVYQMAGVVFFLLVLLLTLNWIAPRFWCRYLCPLGGLLAIFSKVSFFRRTVSQDCSQCGQCQLGCPTGTIDPANNFQSDPAECIVCYDCISDCARHQSGFAFQWKNWKIAPWHAYDVSRRDFGIGLGLALTGSLIPLINPRQKQLPAISIRPPGTTLTNFESLCIRCGECIRVCPTHGLQFDLSENVSLWFTPQLVPRLGYCSYNCTNCLEVCPTGALPGLDLKEKQVQVLGTARIDRDRCLPWAYDTPCIVCEEVCPIPDKAIILGRSRGTVSGRAGHYPAASKGTPGCLYWLWNLRKPLPAGRRSCDPRVFNYSTGFVLRCFWQVFW